MPTPPAPIERITSRFHRWLYRRSGGRRGGTVGANQRPVGLLTTTGRRTGREREWPVIYLRDEGRFVIVASNAGRDHHPAWYLNLREDPECVFQVGEQRIEVVARTASGSERERLWPKLTDMYPGYESYDSKTDRIQPVVILEPF